MLDTPVRLNDYMLRVQWTMFKQNTDSQFLLNRILVTIVSNHYETVGKVQVSYNVL